MILSRLILLTYLKIIGGTDCNENEFALVEHTMLTSLPDQQGP